jgi:hypothetical protein
MPFGSWPLLVMWFDTAIEVYSDVIDVPTQAFLAVSYPWRRRPSFPASYPRPPHSSLTLGILTIPPPC